MLIDRIKDQIKTAKGSTTMPYDTSIGEFFIDISPTERLYFGDMEQGDWESDAKFAERMDARRAEIAATLVKFVEGLK